MSIRQERKAKNSVKICSIGLLVALLSFFTATQQSNAEDNGTTTCNTNAKLIFGINTDGPGEIVSVLNVSDNQTLEATVSGTYMEEGKPQEIRVTRTLRPGVNAYVGKTINSKPGIDSAGKISSDKEATTSWKIVACTTL